MKKIKYILIFIFLFMIFPSISFALSDEEAANYFNQTIEKVITNNDVWEVHDAGNSNYQITVPVANLTDKVNETETIQNVADRLVLSKSNVTLFGYDDEKMENISYRVAFNIKEENGKIYLDNSIVSYENYNGIQKSKKIKYTIISKINGLAWTGKEIKLEGTYTPAIQVDEGSLDKTEGSINNPKIIKGSQSITITEDQYMGENGCYYIKFDYSGYSSKQAVRYTITPYDYAVDIYWGNNSEGYLGKRIGQDRKDENVYGVSNKNIYAICQPEEVTIQFTYKDDKPLNVLNDMEREEIEKQNGEGSTTKVDGNEGEEYKFDPLCGKNGEDCDISVQGICGDPKVARTLQFLGFLLFIAKILVPAIIIIMGIVNLVKIITAGKAEDAPKYVKNIIARIVVGVVIFILPGLINFIFDIANDVIGSNSNQIGFENCATCVLDPQKCIIDN